MPGVQSFVAQRQQISQISNRQTLGLQNRVPVPRTNLERIKERPSHEAPDAIQPAGIPVAGHSTHSSKQHSAKTSIFQGGFETDVEGFDDDTATMSTGCSSRDYQGEDADCDKKSNRRVAKTSKDFVSRAQVSRVHKQDQKHRIYGSRQLETKDSAGEADEGSYSESPDEGENDEDSDEGKLIHDEILQDLNSPGFSQYLQGQTSDTNQANSEPIVAVPEAHTRLVIRDVSQHSQRPAHVSKSTGNGMDRRAAAPTIVLQPVDHQAHERTIEQGLRVPIQNVQGPSMEQSSISAQLRQLSDHHLSSQQPSVNLHQTWRPTEVARSVMATYLQPQANEDGQLLAQERSIDLGAAGSSVFWGSDMNRRHDMIPRASVDGPQTRKHARDLDYRLDQRSSTTFEQLSNEPFDLASASSRLSIPQEISDGNLAAKMDYILEKLKNDEAKFVQRRAIFSSLSIEQYEESANLMIGRFSAIMSRLTDARQQRRRVAKDFEEEVAKREGCILGKIAAVSQSLSRLKRGGEEVVRGASGNPEVEHPLH